MEFTSWTGPGVLRRASVARLRDDDPASEVRVKKARKTAKAAAPASKPTVSEFDKCRVRLTWAVLNQAAGQVYENQVANPAVGGFRCGMSHIEDKTGQQVRSPGAASMVSAIANPLLRKLYQLWDNKRGAQPAPSRADFTVEDLRPWLGHLVILDCLEGDDFRFRLYGTGLVDIFGFDLTNTLVSAAVDRIGAKPMAEYRQVRITCRPCYVARGSPSSRDYLAMDKLALPLMDQGTVSKILAAIYLSDRE